MSNRKIKPENLADQPVVKPTIASPAVVDEKVADQPAAAKPRAPKPPKAPKIAAAPPKYKLKREQAQKNKSENKRYDSAYCVRCKKSSPILNVTMGMTKNNRPMLKGVCSCGCKIHCFIPSGYSLEQRAEAKAEPESVEAEAAESSESESESD